MGKRIGTVAFLLVRLASKGNDGSRREGLWINSLRIGGLCRTDVGAVGVSRPW